MLSFCIRRAKLVGSSGLMSRGGFGVRVRLLCRMSRAISSAWRAISAAGAVDREAKPFTSAT